MSLNKTTQYKTKLFLIIYSVFYIYIKLHVYVCVVVIIIIIIIIIKSSLILCSLVLNSQY